MPHIQETQVTHLKVRTGCILPAKEEAPAVSAVEWRQPVRRYRGESFLKNLGVSAALVLCAVTLRSGAIPSASDAAEVVLTAATDDSLLDDQLGKLSFVSALFPEAALVFSESLSSESVSLSVSSEDVVHTWSQAEPYLSWRTGEQTVVSASSGEVIGVYHGNGDECLVQVMGTDGLACLYGNLAKASVKTGDSVSTGDTLGVLLPGAECVLEIRRDGISIDPALYLNR